MRTAADAFQQVRRACLVTGCGIPQVLDLGAPLWDSLDGDGSPVPTQPLHTDDHCLSIASGNMFHYLRNTRYLPHVWVCNSSAVQTTLGG